jgi:predicted metal-dependent hydrolase
MKQMDVELYRRGLELFNRAEFYDAHEVLEDVWRASAAPEKLFLQALIQAAVALHHHSTGNSVGACSVLARSLRNLEGYPEGFCGVELQPLRNALAECLLAITKGDQLPALPQVAFSGERKLSSTEG